MSVRAAARAALEADAAPPRVITSLLRQRLSEKLVQMVNHLAAPDVCLVLTLADVTEVRGRLLVTVEDLRFTLHPGPVGFDPELELMSHRCDVCGCWVYSLALVASLADVGRVLKRHDGVHEGRDDMDETETPEPTPLDETQSDETLPTEAVDTQPEPEPEPEQTTQGENMSAGGGDETSVVNGEDTDPLPLPARTVCARCGGYGRFRHGSMRDRRGDLCPRCKGSGWRYGEERDGSDQEP